MREGGINKKKGTIGRKNRSRIRGNKNIKAKERRIEENKIAVLVVGLF